MDIQIVLLVLQILVAIGLIGAVLVQRSAQDGGGLTGGGATMGGLFTARGSANVLTRATAVLATIFIVNSLALGYLASREHRNRNLLDQIPTSAPPTDITLPAPASDSEAPIKPTAPDVPMAK